MNEGTDPSQPAAGTSAAELIKQLTEQVSELLRDELKLARLEMSRKGKQAGVGLSLAGAAGFVAVFGLACLIACAVIALSGVIAAWLAALVVGGGLLAIAGIAAVLGKSHLGKATPPTPAEAVDDVKADVQVVKEKVRR